MSSEIRHHTLVNAQLLMENSKLCKIVVKCIIQRLDLCNFVPLLQMPIICYMKVMLDLLKSFQLLQ